MCEILNSHRRRCTNSEPLSLTSVTMEVCRLLKLYAHSMAFSVGSPVHTRILYVPCNGWCCSATICNLQNIIRENIYNFDIDKRRRRDVGMVGSSAHRSFVVSTRHICLFVHNRQAARCHNSISTKGRLSTLALHVSLCVGVCVRVKYRVNGNAKAPMASNHQLVFDEIRSWTKTLLAEWTMNGSPLPPPPLQPFHLFDFLIFHFSRVSRSRPVSCFLHSFASLALSVESEKGKNRTIGLPPPLCGIYTVFHSSYSIVFCSVTVYRSYGIAILD